MKRSNQLLDRPRAVFVGRDLDQRVQQIRIDIQSCIRWTLKERADEDRAAQWIAHVIGIGCSSMRRAFVCRRERALIGSENVEVQVESAMKIGALQKLEAALCATVGCARPELREGRAR